jgi:hypothetical protein
MRIWMDADNAPHVLVMKPLARELRSRGHDVVFTARPRAGTVELLAMHGIRCTVIGGGSARGLAGKAIGTLVRALALARAARLLAADVSFGHGSRALPIASRLAGVPSVTMYDYEWVDPRIFNRFCRTIILPEVVDPARCAEAGIRPELVRRFPGCKEELYLSGWAPDTVRPAWLGDSDRVGVLVRPPAGTAHYHVPEAERIYRALMSALARAEGVETVLIPRSPGDVPVPLPPGLRIPDGPVDGPGLIWHMDAVFGGGGTMTREAAVLGIPSWSFFRGRCGRVDEALEAAGRLAFMDEVEAGRCSPRRRDREPAVPHGAGPAALIASLITGESGPA